MKSVILLFAAITVLLLTGCATTQIDWGSRIGTYTYDEAVLELGVPERQATLSDGTIVAEWLSYRGTTYATHNYYPFYYRYSRFHTMDVHQTPDRYVRLVFGPDKLLSRVENVAR